MKNDELELGAVGGGGFRDIETVLCDEARAYDTVRLEDGMAFHVTLLDNSDWRQARKPRPVGLTSIVAEPASTSAINDDGRRGTVAFDNFFAIVCIRISIVRTGRAAPRQLVSF